MDLTKANPGSSLFTGMSMVANLSLSNLWKFDTVTTEFKNKTPITIGLCAGGIRLKLYLSE
jgi:hypothetical protein